MPGDRGLAFVLIGLMGWAIVWVSDARMHTAHAKPAINAYATAHKASAVKVVSILRLRALDEDGKTLASTLGLTPLD